MQKTRICHVNTSLAPKRVRMNGMRLPNRSRRQSRKCSNGTVSGSLLQKRQSPAGTTPHTSLFPKNMLRIFFHVYVLPYCTDQQKNSGMVDGPAEDSTLRSYPQKNMLRIFFHVHVLLYCADQQKKTTYGCLFLLVRVTGVEPARFLTGS